MHLLQVLFHLVRPGKLLSTDGTGEDLSGDPLVVQEGVALEAVLVLEALKNLDLFAFDTSVGPVIGNEGVFEQVQSTDGHVGQRLGLGPRLGGQVTPGPGGLGGHQGARVPRVPRVASRV